MASGLSRWTARGGGLTGAVPSPMSWMRFLRHDKPGDNDICASLAAAALAKRFVFWRAHARERWRVALVQSPN